MKKPSPVKKISKDIPAESNQEEKEYAAAGKGKETDFKAASVEKLLQELQLHQVELEMQNDELRIANEQLEHQQIKFSGIYDLAPIGYFILDKTGVINEVNDAGTGILETGKGSILKYSLQSFVTPDYSDTYHRFYRAMINTGLRQSCQLKMRSKKGKEFHVQVEGIAITPSPAHPLQCDIAVIDISERVEAEVSLAKTKERLELALDAAAAGTWELELDTMNFQMDEFNYQFFAITGSNFDGRYQSFIRLIYYKDREMVDQHFRTSLNNQKEIDVECRFINENGNISYISIRGHVITELKQSKRFVGIMMDITEKKRIEAESARLKDDHQKLIALATLSAENNERQRISDALHDGVSQLLYGIRIKLGALEQNNAKDTMRDLNNLLDMAIQETRNISFELAPSILNDFGLPATIEDLAKRLSTAEMKIKTHILSFNERLDLPLEISIFRIIQELINNCMKHSAANLIIVELKLNKFIEICVKDNGAGFDTGLQDVLPSGSGFSSIKNRISVYNGSMQVDSTPGLGTVVKIKLNYKS